MKKIYSLIITIIFLSINSWGQQSRVWSTYYGGTGIEFGNPVTATDALGNVYLACYTTSTTLIASGGFQNTHGGGTNDAFLVKFDASGNRLWATYYGGTGLDAATQISVDASGNVFMAGFTQSATGIASGGHQNIIGGSSDAFLVKFDASGNRLWATYYGSTGYSSTNGITTDATGNVYLSGTTDDVSAIASGGHQNIYGGGVEDAFLVKFNSSGVRQWATYYGGTAQDGGRGVSVDATGNVYFGGRTASTASIASGGFQNTYGGGPNDAFLVKFNSSGVRQWATYYGGTGGAQDEDSWDVCNDNSGNIYLSGGSSSTAGIASAGHQNTNGGGTDGMLVKFDASGARLWATYYGGTASDFAYAVITDAFGNVYLGGNTSSTTNISSGGFQNTFGGGGDAFLVKFDASGNRIAATYYGDIGAEGGNGLAMDGSDIIYLSGATTSTTNIASGGFQNTFGGGSNDAYLVKFRTCSVAPTQPISISGTTTICSGTTNTYSVTAVAGATSYTWTLPGGWTGTSTTNSINATASATSGNITVTANNTCGNSTAQTLAVVVNTIPTTPGTISGLASMCIGTGAQTYSITAVGGATSYTWSLPATWSGTSTTNNIVATPGTSGGNITVTANNTCGNSSPQTLAVVINPLPVVTYSQSPSLVCVNATSVALGTVSPTGGTFTGTSVTGSTFNASTAGTGTFNITYTYTDGNGCVNSAISSIVVDPCTSINQIATDDIIVYPNPTNSIITLTGIENESKIEVFNVLGEKVISLHSQNTSANFNLSKLDNGVYFIKISSEKGIVSKKIIKE